jgi:hypothetical protein
LMLCRAKKESSVSYKATNCWGVLWVPRGLE